MRSLRQKGLISHDDLNGTEIPDPAEIISEYSSYLLDEMSWDLITGLIGRHSQIFEQSEQKRVRDARPEELALWFSSHSEGARVRLSRFPLTLDAPEHNVELKDKKEKREKKRKNENDSGQSKKPRKSSDNTCWTCGKPGHHSNECPDKNSSTTTTSANSTVALGVANTPGGKKSSKKTGGSGKPKKGSKKNCMSLFAAQLVFKSDNNGRFITTINIISNNTLIDCRVWIDSASDESLLDEDYGRRHNLKFLPHNSKLLGLGGQKRLNKRVKVVFKINNFIFKLSLLVVNSEVMKVARADVVFGIDALGEGHPLSFTIPPSGNPYLQFNEELHMSGENQLHSSYHRTLDNSSDVQDDSVTPMRFSHEKSRTDSTLHLRCSRLGTSHPQGADHSNEDGRPGLREDTYPHEVGLDYSHRNPSFAHSAGKDVAFVSAPFTKSNLYAVATSPSKESTTKSDNPSKWTKVEAPRLLESWLEDFPPSLNDYSNLCVSRKNVQELKGLQAQNSLSAAPELLIRTEVPEGSSSRKRSLKSSRRSRRKTSNQAALRREKTQSAIAAMHLLIPVRSFDNFFNRPTQNKRTSSQAKKNMRVICAGVICPLNSSERTNMLAKI
jgi:hypothetical protein